MEEFEEFDVLFSENPQQEKKKKKKTGLDSMKVHPELLNNNNKHSSSISKEEEEEEEEKSRRKNKKKMSISVPMRIPPSGNSILNRVDEIFEQETEETAEEGRKRLLFVPPHLMVEQQRSTSKRMMAFSVCTGNGRTLKGRDLSRVRNSVLRMTGFIETC